MKLYIRNHPDEVTQPWWDRFEATLIPRHVGTGALKKHVEDRRAKLESYGALLQWERSTGLPYLEFNNEKDMVWFMLEWS